MKDLISYRWLSKKECAHGQSFFVFCFDCYMVERYFLLDKDYREAMKQYRNAVDSGNLMLMRYYLENYFKDVNYD